MLWLFCGGIATRKSPLTLTSWRARLQGPPAPDRHEAPSITRTAASPPSRRRAGDVADRHRSRTSGESRSTLSCIEPLSAAKPGHDLPGKEPHLTEQEIRGVVFEQAHISEREAEVLQAALSKVLDHPCDFVGVSRDDVVMLAQRSDVARTRLRADIRRAEAGQRDFPAAAHRTDLLRTLPYLLRRDSPRQPSIRCLRHTPE